MDFNHPWTIFAVTAEVDHYGVSRIVKAHQGLRKAHDQLRTALRELILTLDDGLGAAAIEKVDGLETAMRNVDTVLEQTKD